MNDDITMTQVKAGEDAVVERLRRKGLLPPVEPAQTVEDICAEYPEVSKIYKAIEQRRERQELESTLATTFIAQQQERRPSERTRLWNRCLELVAELERMNKSDN